MEIVLSRAGQVPYRFSGWNHFDTIYGEVNLGEIAQSQTRSFNAKLAPTFSGTLIGAGEIGGGDESKLEEKLVLRDTVVKMSGTLTEAEGRIVQQGAIGSTLEGNVSLNLSLELETRPIRFVELGPLFNDKGEAKSAKEITPRIFPTRVPVPVKGGSVVVDVHTNYHVRHVTKGAETIIEGDDVVTKYYGKTGRETVTVLDERAFEKLCAVHYAGSVGKPITMGRPGQRSEELIFDTEEKVEEFTRWLRIQEADPIVLGSDASRWTLGLGDGVLRPQSAFDKDGGIDLRGIQLIERIGKDFSETSRVIED